MNPKNQISIDGADIDDTENRCSPKKVIKVPNTGARWKDVEASGESTSQSSQHGVAVDEQNAPDKMKLTKIALIMAALCLAVFLAALDISIITTALPTIVTEFRASEADYTWIGAAYLLGAAASTPSWGKISDIFGRKPMLLVANVIFLIGSLLCAVSLNVRMLIGGRAVQGIGGGGLLTLVNISISDLFSMRTRSIYFGLIGMVWAVAGALGPVSGGLFTQFVSWRWCFYINLPLDGIAFFIILVFLKIETPRTPILDGLRAIDWLGSLTVVGGTVMFLLGLEYGGISYPWSSAVVICLVVFGLVTLAMFLLIQWKLSNYPIMPLWLFAQRSTVAAYGTAFVHASIYICDSFFLPLYFQTVLGATPLQSGLYFLTLVISLCIVSVLVGVFIQKTGQYLPAIWFGMTVMLIGKGLYIDLPAYISWPRIIIFQLISGIGIGPNFQSPLIALQSHIKPNDMATATATFSFIRNIANSVSVVLGGVIFQNQVKANLAKVSARLPEDVVRKLGESSAGAATSTINSLPDTAKKPVIEAYLRSFRAMWIFYTVLAAVGLLVSLFIGKKTLNKDHEITRTGLDVQKREREERLMREEKRGRTHSK